MGVLLLGQLDNGTVRAYLDYNDANRNIQRAGVENTSSKFARIIVEDQGSIIFDQTFAPNSTTTRNVVGYRVDVDLLIPFSRLQIMMEP